jgi:maltose O-acetyltransferase
MKLRSKIKHILFVTLRKLKYSILSDARLEGVKPKCDGPVLFSGQGKIIIGKNVQFGYKQSPLFYSHYSYVEARTAHSTITIGKDVIINNNCNMVAMVSIQIKDNCTIGINFSAIDSDFHHLNPKERNNVDPPSQPVVVGKNVFIGNNVTLLKGVTIGDNSVIGNGSIVTKPVPANVVAAGIPAKIIKTL